MNRIKNMTPHEIVVVGEKENITIPSEGVVRVSETRNLFQEINGVKIYTKQFGKSDDLPEEVEGQFVIVSVPVAQAHTERNDLIIADDIVRNQDGKIIGCKSFAKLIRE